MHLSEAVAMRIAYFCKEKSLSINKLSIQCGLRQSTVSNILNGTSKNPTIASIKKICDGLEISLLNALSYGVPQFREREIMVGISKQLFEDLGYQASPDGSFEFPWDEHAIGEVEEILNQPWPTMQRFVANSRRVNRWTDFEELVCQARGTSRSD